MKNKAQKTIELFMLAWIAIDIRKMYDLCQITWKNSHTKADLKRLIYPQTGQKKRLRIKSYQILEIRRAVTAIADDTVYDIDLKVSTRNGDRKLTARLICETAPFKASVDGEFGVNPVSIIKNLY